MNILNVDEKLQILKWHYDGNSLKEVSNLFKTAFRTRYNPSETTCRRIVRHFEATGCLHNCNLCRKIPFLNETAVSEKQQLKLVRARVHNILFTAICLIHKLNHGQKCKIKR
ncbi:Helix-turn-helix domain (DUF4817) [Popillia japonica]|uniref:Helix-turn-helix domain (DUF4817) n=1 Tax=Popillia japonica TaxID=7064 RepID=A0AAW1LVW7_POPJA